MSRSGSAGRSFLDDLLADDFDKPNTSAKRKSVRFMDNDDNTDIFATNLMSSLSSRETSAKDRQRSVDPMEWSKTDASIASNKAIVGTKSSSKSDWLGLGDNEDHDKQTKAQTLTDRTQKQTSDAKDDWLSSGLTVRKSRATIEPKSSFETTEKTEDNSWLSIRKKAEESKVKTTEPNEEPIPQIIDNSIEQKKSTNLVITRSEPEISSIKSNEKVAPIQSMQTDAQILDTNITTSLSTSSVMLLQTQVSGVGLQTNSTESTLIRSEKLNFCQTNCQTIKIDGKTKS